MNELTGSISNIQTDGSLTIVSVRISDTIVLKIVVVDSPDSADYLQISRRVSVLFKETDVIVTRSRIENTSIENQLSGTITSTDQSELLGKLVIETSAGQISAIVNSEFIIETGPNAGDSVTVCLRMYDLMLSPL